MNTKEDEDQYKQARIKRFSKFKRCVRKLYISTRLMNVKKKDEVLLYYPDLLKRKYFHQLDEFIMTAEHGLYLNCRPILLIYLMKAVGLAYNVPDMYVLKHCFLIIAIYSEFQNDLGTTLLKFCRLFAKMICKFFTNSIFISIIFQKSINEHIIKKVTTGTIYFIENGLYSYQRLKDIAESTKEYGKRLLLFLEL